MWTNDIWAKEKKGREKMASNRLRLNTSPTKAIYLKQTSNFLSRCGWVVCNSNEDKDREGIMKIPRDSASGCCVKQKSIIADVLWTWFMKEKQREEKWVCTYKKGRGLISKISKHPFIISKATSKVGNILSDSTLGQGFLLHWWQPELWEPSTARVPSTTKG